MRFVDTWSVGQTQTPVDSLSSGDVEELYVAMEI